MKILNITVTNKIATYFQRDGVIVCGNNDYKIKFTFDSEWDDHAKKTARFIWNGQYYDKEFEGNECDVPIISGATEVTVGVYAGDLSTTTPATIPCKKSILCAEAMATEGLAKDYVDEALHIIEDAGTEAVETVREAALEAVGNLGVVQSTGNSETAVMSQKVTTEEISKIRGEVNKTSEVLGMSSIIVSGTAEAVSPAYSKILIANGFSLKAGETYTFKGTVNTKEATYSAYLYLDKEDGTTLKSINIKETNNGTNFFTLTADSDYDNMSMSMSVNKTSGLSVEASLENIGTGVPFVSKDELYSRINLTWENGTIDGTSGENATSPSTVCRAVGYIDVSFLHSISVIRPKTIYAYDEAKTYISNVQIPANSTLSNSDILALWSGKDVAYVRIRSDWGENADTVDKVTIVEDINLRKSVEYTDNCVAESETEIMKKVTEMSQQFVATDELYSEAELTWENGTIDGTSGENAIPSSGTVCRAVGYIDVSFLHSISVIRPKTIYAYDEAKTYISNVQIPANSTLSNSDILALWSGKDVAYVRIRSDWGENADTVDKVTIVEDIKVKASAKYTDRCVERAVTKKVADELYSELPLTWENGSIDGTKGVDMESPSAVCRAVGYINASAIYSLSVIKPKVLFAYDEAKTYISNVQIPANSTLYNSDILSLWAGKDVVYIRVRSDWGESAVTVDKVAIVEDNKVKASAEYTDKSVTEAKAEMMEQMAEISHQFAYADYGLPIVYLNGNTTGISKDNKVTLNYIYGDKSGTCTLKWQGSSSIQFPKKNYTIVFDNAFEAVEGWGEEKKYCLKADWVDFSHCRNVVSAKLWGDIVRGRTTSDLVTRLTALPNCGAIDGFPCFVVINGEWQGVYNFNIPKDGYMFGMGSGTKEAIVCCEGVGTISTNACSFNAEATLGTEFELEYSSDGWAESEIQASLNTLIRAIMNSDGSDIDTTIAQYLDIDSAIDYVLFTQLLNHHDGILKNYILATYDGTKWFFSAYDMDNVFGQHYPGDNFDPASLDMLRIKENRLFSLLYTHKFDKLRSRLNELMTKRYSITGKGTVQDGVMSSSSVAYRFTNYATKIPLNAYTADAERWPSVPSTTTNNIWQAISWYAQRSALVKALYDPS